MSPRQAARELNHDRANPAGAADDQERARIDAFSGDRAETVEQQFPGRERGQRQGGRLRKRQRLRLGPDDPLIDQVKFRIGALALDRAGVENLITRLEQRHLGSDRIDDAGRVIAQNLEFTFGRSGALADLVIDGIGGDRLDGDADVLALRFGLGGLEIEQGFRSLDGQRFFISDGLHWAVLPLKIQVLTPIKSAARVNCKPLRGGDFSACLRPN